MSLPTALLTGIVFAAAIALAVAAIVLFIVLAIRSPRFIRPRAAVAASAGALWIMATASAWLSWRIAFDRADDNLARDGSYALWLGSLAIGAVALIVGISMLVAIRRATDASDSAAGHQGELPDVGDILSA